LHLLSQLLLLEAQKGVLATHIAVAEQVLAEGPWQHLSGGGAGLGGGMLRPKSSKISLTNE